MTDLKKNVPELRFPEFEGEWEEKKISDSIKILKSGLSRELSANDIGLPVIRANNLQDYRLVLDDVKYWYKEDPQGANTAKYLLEKNDILINFINSESKMGTSCILTDDCERESIYTTNILRYVTKENFDSYFHFIYTQTYEYRKWIKIITKPAVNQASFTTVDFKKIPYHVPEIKEQQKIGDFFSKLDRQIELEEQKLVLLEEQKKGYMQKIFSQELRFKDDNGNDYPEWEEKKLSDLGSYSKSYSFSRDVEGEGKVHHIHYGDIHSKLPSRISDINLLPTIKESKDFEFLQKGDIIFADASEDYKDLGKAIMVDIDEDNIIAGLHTHVFRPNLQVVSEFLMYYTKTLNYFKFIKRQGTGISVLGISKKNLSNFILGLPEYKEQQKIGDFFSKLDQQIELQGQKIENLKQRKKGLLQKMFV
ncbi:restriction endonuclease subunit S [Staphylococcus pseudintermedius]|uniref:restriction endonuclease subunit S n=1 Tax=Staphylococcus pseudintermedius TaxID=283734 RepID=UPI0018F5B4AF|nr:restriction endonuclease subunit S [Staphylococcus pseudintermedius]MBJ8317156.1 restriction endonuclease subunit S [Staphylococcus pseudintermedius]